MKQACCSQWGNGAWTIGRKFDWYSALEFMFLRNEQSWPGEYSVPECLGTARTWSFAMYRVGSTQCFCQLQALLVLWVGRQDQTLVGLLKGLFGYCSSLQSLSVLDCRRISLLKIKGLLRQRWCQWALIRLIRVCGPKAMEYVLLLQHCPPKPFLKAPRLLRAAWKVVHTSSPTGIPPSGLK